MAALTMGLGATVVFAAFAVLMFGTLLTFAAMRDRQRNRRIEQDAPERAHQPAAARFRWLHRG